MNIAVYPQKIHIWVPNLFGFKGGIQVYSDYFLRALQQSMPQSQIEIFIMHDVCADVKPTAPYVSSTSAQLHFAGRVPHRLRNPAYAMQLLVNGLLQRPDLIITTHLNFTPVARIIWQMTKIPYWTVAHGVEAWNIQRPKVQKGLQSANHILPVSEYTRRRLLSEQQLNSDRLSTLANTVDTQRFQICPKPERLLQKYGLSAEQSVILTVSRLCSTESFNSYDPVLAALPIIKEEIPDVHYIIVGKGDDRNRLEQAIRDQQLTKHVTLAGFVPDDELCDYYNLCDVFALPSKLEGFGIVYLEALACGKPALGGNQDGAMDALCAGKLGALVDPDDSEVIAQALIQILNNSYPNPLMYQPQALRQSVIETYGFNTFKQKLSSLLTDFSKTLPVS